MITVLFAADRDLWPHYAPPLRQALDEAGIAADVVTEADPATVDYIVFSPGGTVQDFRPYTRTRAVLNLWAGVERVVQNDTLTQPLCRMVDPAMTDSMAEWVAAHVLRHHLGTDVHVRGQDGVWRHDKAARPPLAPERPVTILGLGELGRACARVLAPFGFPLTGWSRSPAEVPGMRCLSSPGGLDAALRGAAMVILLVPRTPQTENILNARTLALLAPGAFVINPGRGPLIDDDALLAALDSGHVAHATLDVFRQEPLPPDHPFWAHPRVTVTPHVAAYTRPETASRVIAQNIVRGQAGLPFLHLVDRARGY
ncbi:MAG: glyoxylate/hydroxypyruvate reductase A [Paracoccaceae bacterium]|nr:MAG: glyoxylate/hydroxypyruvate reductase A [Paracoccaceae bacterium]